MEDRVLVDEALRGEIREAVELAREHIAPAEEPERAAGHALLLERPLVARRHIAPGGIEAGRFLGPGGIRNARDKGSGADRCTAGVRRTQQTMDEGTSHDHGISRKRVEHAMYRRGAGRAGCRRWGICACLENARP